MFGRREANGREDYDKLSGKQYRDRPVYDLPRDGYNYISHKEPLYDRDMKDIRELRDVRDYVRRDRRLKTDGRTSHQSTRRTSRGRSPSSRDSYPTKRREDRPSYPKHNKRRKK